MKRFIAFLDWLGGPDRKNGKTVWRKGHWRTYENEKKVYICNILTVLIDNIRYNNKKIS